MRRSKLKEARHPIAYTALRRFVTNYEWFHTSVGIFGNTVFFIGSVLFLFESLKRAGIWLFIIGSFGMLLGSIGRAIVQTTESSNSR